MYMASLGRKSMLQVAAETIRHAIRQRRYYRGYMGSCELALKIVISGSRQVVGRCLLPGFEVNSVRC
jgi:hypothetical protein